MTRAVLDTNVVLSALLFRGPAAALRVAWQSGRVVPLAGADTTRELMRTLAYPKFRLSAAEQEELLAEYLPHSEVVAATGREVRAPRCRDPFDQMFVELAIRGQAQALVSGDADLLALAGRVPCEVVDLRTFLSRLTPAGTSG